MVDDVTRLFTPVTLQLAKTTPLGPCECLEVHTISKDLE